MYTKRELKRDVHEKAKDTGKGGEGGRNGADRDTPPGLRRGNENHPKGK